MWDVFSGEKKNPGAHFLTCGTLISSGEKQLCSQLCFISVGFLLLLSFVSFFSVRINFWGLFFSFKTVCRVLKYNTVAVLNSGIIVINCSSRRTKR